MINDRLWTLVSRKLSGEATNSEMTELGELINTPDNSDLYVKAIEEFWITPPEKDDEFLEATYHLHLNRLKKKGFDLETDKEKDDSQPLFFDLKKDVSKKSLRRKMRIAAPVFSLIILLFFFISRFENSVIKTPVEKIAQSEISTKTGSRTKIQLPDGSSVWLNGGSKLVYDNRNFGENTREVTLTGEAYFDVTKNKDKPFIIHANKINIKVIGTAFNIKAYPGEKNTETSLVRGSIEVSFNGRKEKIMMKPNDKLVVSNEAVNESSNIISKNYGSIVVDSVLMSMGHLTLASDENTVVETAWVENKLVFDKETFGEVALKMERWYGVDIRFADHKLKLQRLTGTFEKETIIEALQALQISTPFFKYKINNQNINIF